MSAWSPPSATDRSLPFGVAVPVGAAAVAGVCLVAGALPAGDTGRLWLPALAVGGMAYAARDVLAGTALATIAFLFVDGFLENRAGVLSWHAGDASRIGLLVMCGVLGAALAAFGVGLERRRERVAGRRLEHQLAVVEVWANSAAAHGHGEEVR